MSHYRSRRSISGSFSPRLARSQVGHHREANASSFIVSHSRSFFVRTVDIQPRCWAIKLFSRNRANLARLRRPQESVFANCSFQMLAYTHFGGGFASSDLEGTSGRASYNFAAFFLSGHPHKKPAAQGTSASWPWQTAEESRDLRNRCLQTDRRAILK